MSQQQQMAMTGMGGPVGGPTPNAPTPTNSMSGLGPQDYSKRLNSAIYEYLLCCGKYDAARAFKTAMPIEWPEGVKQSPNQNQANGVDVEIESRDSLKNKPDDLPLPVALSEEPGPFLMDWWLQFWELYQGNRRNGKQTTLSYVGQQRMAQKTRTGMMTAMDPNAAQRNFNMMNNGMGDLRQQTAIKNMNQQQLNQMNKMRAGQAGGNQMPGAPMERQGSQMDRNGSPNAGTDAPSPKRQRIEGNMNQMNQARPGQPGQMQGGNQVGTPSNAPPPFDALPAHTRELLLSRGLDPSTMSQEQLQKMSAQPTNIQAKSVENYSQAIQQHMQAAMQRTGSNANKGMPPNPAMGPGGAQSSPMNQQGIDGAGNEFYNNRMGMPQNGAAVAAAGQQGAANNGNHALQDYQMQLMLLEQQNKKRLLMARQEQDSMAHPNVPGPNGNNFAPGMSPQGSRAGDPSPNPNEMNRGRGSPTPGMMDPSAVPGMRPQMVMGPNGQPVMRPPSSHPMAGQMTPQQMEMLRANGGMMPNGANWQGPPGGPQGPMMPGQQPGQGQPGQPPNMTPRQGNMPPPPAPANAAGTQPSSPAQQPAPPTPSQGNKGKPANKKDAAKKNAPANKKGANAAESQEANAPPTPTPPPPMTPNNAASFNKNGQLPNGQPTPAQQNTTQPPGAPPVQQVPDMNAGPFGNIGGDDFGNMDFADLGSGDVLDNFDFDSFLNNTGDNDGLAFDANFAFGDAGAELDMSH
ncbi:hypothetical protein PRZ48_004634 [Zasmidium cellare]|uniref:LisH domain-containing protein n=1 Tax=Zasmidium cellare TaxID=395010 RepID=A0ABR0EQ30_ZASCE|nr:hypothetical protein PRZ48_004634 [Zasmidium cellare]